MLDQIKNPDNKRELLKYPYPMNLFLTLLSCTVEPPEFTDDILDGIAYAISTLNDRQREVLRQRYEERKTYKAIAASFGVTTQRSRNAEYLAFRKLRHPKLLGFILYGKQGYADMNYVYRSPWTAEEVKEETPKKADPEYLQKPIAAMDLTVGAENRLLRAGYECIGDLVKLTHEEIQGIKYLTSKNRVEIAECLYRNGVTDTCWVDYVLVK